MIRRALVALIAAGAILAAPEPAVAAARPIRMSGQQITQVLVADLAYFYRHERPRAPRFELAGGGTEAGIADTARGIADAGLVSRGLEPGDPPGLVLTRLARSGVCLVSHRSNPVPSISRALLQDIVAGRVTSWRQVPGSTRADPIVPVALDPGTGAAHVFEQVFVDDDTPTAWRPVTLLLSLQARDYVERTPAAFAYMDFAFTRPVHSIPYEGVPCTRATIRDGRYPATRPLGVVTAGRPRGELRRFLRWVRTSRVARRVIATRYVPIRSTRPAGR
jgi:phosphate transport system substrate-binding protein